MLRLLAVGSSVCFNIIISHCIVFLCPCHLTVLARHRVFRLSSSFVRSSGQILLPRCLMNGLNNFDKTDREYSLAPLDDLVKFGRSRLSGSNLVNTISHKLLEQSQ